MYKVVPNVLPPSSLIGKVKWFKNAGIYLLVPVQVAESKVVKAERRRSGILGYFRFFLFFGVEDWTVLMTDGLDAKVL